MKYTENINLKKPDITDNVKISDINENMDIVDGKINSLEEKVGSQTALETISQDLSGAVNELHLEVDDLAREVNEPLYQTVSSSSDVISLPDDGVEGQVNVGLKGKTINILNDNGIDYTNWTIAGTGTTKGTNGIHLVADTTNDFASLSTNLSPDTQYTVVFRITDKNNDGDFYISDDLLNNYTIYPISVGWNKLLITTKSIISINQLKFTLGNNNTDGGYVDLVDIMILEGDWTNKEVHYMEYGTKSTVNHRIKSVGKNRFDKNRATRGTVISNGTFSPDSNSTYGYSDFIPVIGGQSYKKTVSYNCAFYDKNKTFIQLLAYSTTVTPPDDGYIVFNFDWEGIDTTQLEIGTTATTHEPYKESVQYITLPDSVEGLHSLPNDVKDEVKDGKLYKRISDELTVSGANYTDYATTLTNVDVIRVRISYIVNDISQLDSIGKVDVFGKEEVAVADRDNTSSIGKFYTVSTTEEDIWFIVDKGSYTDLADVQANFPSYTLIYQLAEEKIYNLNTKPLTCFENGTIIFENIIPEVSFYDDVNGCKITYTEYPIHSIDFIRKVDKKTGQYKELDVNLATIASDRLLFTHPDLQDNDLINWDYFYPSELSTKGEKKITIPTSLKASVNSNVEGIRYLSKNVQNVEDSIKSLNAQTADLAEEVNSSLYQTVLSNSNIIGLPDTVVKGQISVGVSGVMRTNLAPTFGSGKWTLHSNTVVDSPTKLTLNATSGNQISTITIPVKNSVQYTLSFIGLIIGTRIDVFDGETYIGVLSENGQNITFTPMQDTVKLNLKSNASGTFTFENILLEEGSEVKSFITGTKSTVSTRIKSVGKNLFDGEWVTGKRYTPHIGVVVIAQANRSYSKNLIEIPSNATNVALSRDGTLLDIFVEMDGIYFYDNQKRYINRVFTFPVAVPADAAFVGFNVRTENPGDWNVQFETSTTPTDYAKHEFSETYINLPDGVDALHSLPNGVKDEVKDGKLYKRTNKYVLQSGDIITLTDTLTNVDLVSVAVLPNSIDGGDGTSVQGKVIAEGYTEISRTNRDVSGNDNMFYSYLANIITFVVPKGTYVDLVEAQADLAGTTLIYQLAEPVIYDLLSLRNIYSYDGGTTLIIEPAIEFEAIAGSSGRITIPNTDFPIDYIESVQEKIVDGENISYIDVADTQSDTTTLEGLTEGKKYKVVYHYPQKLTTLPELTISYPVNMAASLSDIYEIQRKLEKELGSVWLTILPLADKELGMCMITKISTPTTATSQDTANKINDILQVWKG